MRQIRYNHATNVLRFEFPVEWKGDDITGATLAIKDRDGAELLAAQSLTLYTATELDGAVAQWQKVITLDSAAEDLAPGDPILIDGVAGPELRRVKGYDAVTYEVKLETILQNDHADADAVYGLWGTYTLDTTTVATWTAGLICTLIWTPAGAGQATTYDVQIAKSTVEVEGLARRFSSLFPRAYKSFTDTTNRLDDMVAEAKSQVYEELDLNNMDLPRIVDQDAISTAIMYKMAVLWAEGADLDKQDERNHLLKQYESKKAIALSRVIWIDQNQNSIEDDGETTDHEHKFARAWF